MDAIESILSNPETAALVAALVLAIYLVSKRLDWQSYYRIHRLKLRYLPMLSPFFFTVSYKGYREDEEYLTTVDASVKVVWQTLLDHGASPHLLNSIKRRGLPDGGSQYSQAHAVWTMPDSDDDTHPEQVEVYLFDNGDGTTDAYAHFEGSVLNPRDHLYGGQTDGDPTGVVREALDTLPK